MAIQPIQPEKVGSFKRFLLGIKAFIRGYHELIAEISAWLASIGCVAIATLLFLPASLSWREPSITVCLGFINLSVEAAFFGSTGAYWDADAREDDAEKKRQGWILFVYGALITATFAFGYFKITDTIALAVLDLSRCVAALSYIFLSYKEDGASPIMSPAVTQKVNELTTLVNAQVQSIQQMSVDYTSAIQDIQQSIQDVQLSIPDVQSIDKGIDTAEFERLAQVVYTMQSSVTEVHNNVLSITQNQYVHPLSTSLYTDDRQSRHPAQDDRHVPATYVEEEQPAIESHRQTGLSDPTKALVVPNIQVDKIAPDKVARIIGAYLSGNTWSSLSKQGYGNYSRDILPVKAAYEAYVQACPSDSKQA